MEFHTLFAYHGLEELRRIQEEREVFPFAFGIKDMIDTCPEVCIDISALIYYLRVEKSNIQPAYINFSGMTNDTVVIAEASIAEAALELLPFIFYALEDYYAKEDVKDPEPASLPNFKPYLRQKVYTYNNAGELDTIIQRKIVLMSKSGLP